MNKKTKKLQLWHVCAPETVSRAIGRGNKYTMLHGNLLGEGTAAGLNENQLVEFVRGTKRGKKKTKRAPWGIRRPGLKRSQHLWRFVLLIYLFAYLSPDIWPVEGIWSDRTTGGSAEEPLQTMWTPYRVSPTPFITDSARAWIRARRGFLKAFQKKNFNQLSPRFSTSQLSSCNCRGGSGRVLQMPVQFFFLFFFSSFSFPAADGRPRGRGGNSHEISRYFFHLFSVRN